VQYCGIAVGPEYQHLCVLREVRADEPPVRLAASFYEPGTVEQVVAQVTALGDAVVGVAAPAGAPAAGRAARACDAELARRGVAGRPYLEPGGLLFGGLSRLGVFQPAGDGSLEGTVPEGAYRAGPVFETNVDGVFAALQGRRVPARRHPLGVRRRVEELLEDHVVDEGGDLWNRRIEEIEAAAAALTAHRYAVGHASWIGDPEEGVIVLPGSRPPAEFSVQGVIPPVTRLPLPG
jgi:predicted nuclease with RNAse H fold